MPSKEKQADSVNEPNKEVYRLTGRPMVLKILDLVRNLSFHERNQLQKELELMQKDEVNPVTGDFSTFLLSGPLMSDAQLEEFNIQRETFNNWRIK